MVAPPVSAQTRVKIRSDVQEYDRPTATAIARGNVRLEAPGIIIETQELRFDNQDKVVTITAPFTLRQTGADGKVQIITGTELSYDLRTERAVVKDVKLEVAAPAPGQVIYITGKEMTSLQKREFEVKDGTFTSCDFVEKDLVPHYHSTAEWIKFVPNDYTMGRNAWVYINNRRVLWLPYWWIPLQRRESNLNIGRNDVEGIFLKTAMAYQINPYHYGNVYANLMEFKGPGVGFDHVWSAIPNSLTAGTFYGLVMPDTADFTPNRPTEENPWYVHGLDPANPSNFQDRYWRFRHQQRLFDTMVTDTWFEDSNIYDLRRVAPTFQLEQLQDNPRLPYRDNHQAYHLGLNDNRFGLDYSLNRDFRYDRGFERRDSTRDQGRVTGTFGATQLNLTTGHQEQRQHPAPVETVGPDGLPALVLPPGASPSVTLDQWDNNLQLNHTFSPTLRGTSNTVHVRSVTPGALGPGGPAETTRETLRETTDLTQSLGWGNARLTVDNTWDLTATGQTQAAIRQLGTIQKIPEIDVTTNPILEQWQPFTLSGVIGRYMETSLFTPGDPVYGAPTNRIKLVGRANSKPIDVGLGTKLNFGETGAEQRFYSTGDAEYQVTGQAQVTTEYTSWLNSQLTYHRDYTPPAAAAGETGTGFNASPFQAFDSLSLRRQIFLRGNVTANVGQQFNFNNQWGYDYQTLRYDPYIPTLRYNPSGLVNLFLSTQYQFPDVPNLRLRGGRWAPLSGTMTFRSTEQAFTGRWGVEEIVPGWQLDTQLSYDFNLGQWSSLRNAIFWTIGNNWRNHWELALEGEYNTQVRQYQLVSVGINKDLHDFIASLQYNRRVDSVMFTISMVAFQTNIVNLSNRSFGGIGDPAQLLQGPGGFGGAFPGGSPGGPMGGPGAPPGGF